MKDRAEELKMTIVGIWRSASEPERQQIINGLVEAVKTILAETVGPNGTIDEATLFTTGSQFSKN